MGLLWAPSPVSGLIGPETRISPYPGPCDPKYNSEDTWLGCKPPLLMGSLLMGSTPGSWSWSGARSTHASHVPAYTSPNTPVGHREGGPRPWLPGQAHFGAPRWPFLAWVWEVDTHPEACQLGLRRKVSIGAWFPLRPFPPNSGPGVQTAPFKRLGRNTTKLDNWSNGTADRQVGAELGVRGDHVIEAVGHFEDAWHLEGM